MEHLFFSFHGFEDGDPRYVTFTANVTESINVVLKGYLKPGMRVLTSSMEHNASMRPLRRLEQRGIILSVLPCTQEGDLPLHVLTEALESSCDLVMINHAITVIHMEVPCCSGLIHLMEKAIEKAKVNLTLNVVKIGIRGDILNRESIKYIFS